MEAEPAQESPGGFLLSRPAAVSARTAVPGHEPGQHAVRDLLAGRGQPSGDKPHDLRIGIQRGQVVNIGHGELAEHQPSGLQQHALRWPFHHAPCYVASDRGTVLPVVPLPGRAVRGSTTGRPIMALFDLIGRRWTLRVIWR
jgi:hypothetical protein